MSLPLLTVPVVRGAAAGPAVVSCDGAVARREYPHLPSEAGDIDPDHHENNREGSCPSGNVPAGLILSDSLPLVFDVFQDWMIGFSIDIPDAVGTPRR